jgi:predicted transcriptional regulator YheO
LGQRGKSQAHAKVAEAVDRNFTVQKYLVKLKNKHKVHHLPRVAHEQPFRAVSTGLGSLRNKDTTQLNVEARRDLIGLLEQKDVLGLKNAVPIVAFDLSVTCPV